MVNSTLGMLTLQSLFLRAWPYLRVPKQKHTVQRVPGFCQGQASAVWLRETRRGAGERGKTLLSLLKSTSAIRSFLRKCGPSMSIKEKSHLFWLPNILLAHCAKVPFGMWGFGFAKINVCLG